MFDFSEVNREQWLTFFSVDALHLIGFGILFIICLSYIADRYKLSDYRVFSFGILFFLFLFPLTDRINWANYLPVPFAAYLYQGCGSLFPFFPWSAYVISGGMIGLYLAKNPECYMTKNFSLRLFGIGAALMAISIFVNQIDEKVLGGTKEFWTDGFSLVFYRIGIVLFLNGAMSFASLRIKKIPEIIKNVGKNTLLIYVVHIVILYGSAWIPGLSLYYSKSFNAFGSLLAAGILIILMFGMVALVEFLKDYRKRKFAAAQI
jgi:predicted acyltransferase